MADAGPEWLQALGGTTAAGLATALIGYLTGRRVSMATARKLAAEAGKIDAEADKVGSDAEAALMAVLNDRIGLMIKGYEKQIDDLTKEVHSLRAEIVSLRKALDDRPKPQAQTRPIEPFGL